MYSYSVSSGGGKMASARGKGKDAIVTDAELEAVEYELLRNKKVEENERRLAVVLEKSRAFNEQIEASKPPKKKRKATSPILESTNERRVLRSSGTEDPGNVDFAHQPSKEITTELHDDGCKKKGGRNITQKANIYSRLNKPKIQIPLNEHGQPIGADATEFANFIGTLVRKHIPPKELDWRDVDEDKKLLVWETLRAFYEVDSTALRYVYNTSHTKWKEWKADLKKSRFDAALTDEELMKKRDSRISEADWKTLIDYWRSPEFEARSGRAKKNRAKSTVPHTSGSKSHARVTKEMADELGYAPRRDEVYIRTHTHKKGHHVPQAAPIIVPEPFVPLTDEDEDKVRHTLGGRKRRETLSVHEASNIFITIEILWCLNDKDRLNDEVFYFFCYMFGCSLFSNSTVSI